MSYLGDSFRADLLSYTPEQAQEPVRKGSPGLMSDIARGTGQFVAGAGSTLRDLGAESVGSAIEQYGAGVVQRNPSEISSLADVVSRPFTTAREAVGEMAPQVGLTVGGALGGRVIGGLLGAPLGPIGVAAGQQIGGYVGGLLPTALQTYGGVRAEQRERGIDDRLLATAVTIPAALLERFGGAERLAMKVAGEGTEFLARAAGQKFWPSVGKQFVRGGLEEAITEVPQTGLERIGAYKDLTSGEALDEYGVAGAKAFLGGGAVRGGLSTFAGTRKAQEPLPEPTVTVLGDGTILQNDAEGRPTQQPITVAGAMARRPTPLGEEQFDVAPTQYDLFRGAVAARAAQPTEETDLTQPRGPDLRQQELFMPGGAPTYGADTSFSPAPLDRDRMAELQDRVAAAAQRGELTAEQGANLLQNILAADRAGVQWQNLIGERTAALLGIEDVAAQGRGLVAQLERDQLARDRGLLAAQQAGAGAQNLPGMTADAGSAADFRRIMNPDVMQPVAPTTALGGSERSTRLFTPTGGATSQLSERPTPAPAPTTPAAPAAVSAQTKPVAPVVSPPSGAPAVQTPAAPAAAGVSLRDDEAELAKLIQKANAAKTGSALQASVQGQGVVRVPGKASLKTGDLQQVRDALLSPEGRVASGDARLQGISDAVREFAKAYSDYEDAGGNAVRTPTAKKVGTAQVGGARRGQAVTAAAQKMSGALAALGTAVSGNAKDVEAVVSLVKSMVQRNLHTAGGNQTFAKAFETMDTMLSRGWNAAKNDVFRGGTDALYVRQSKTDISREARAAGGTQTQLEAAAAGGAAVFGKGDVYDGLLGFLNKLRQSGTPMERLLAKAIRESLFGGDNAPKLAFVGGDAKNEYDPVSHTVYLHRDASPAVVLHEALHAALQRYVFEKGESHPVVKSLITSLDKVLAHKGELTGDAKRVVDELRKYAKDKGNLYAALELVSYGNTLNDFRRLLQKLDSDQVPKTFADKVSILWNSLVNAVRAMLGTNRSVANDVIMDTFQLLREASTARYEKARTGERMQAAVQTGMQPTTPELDLQKYKEGPGWKLNITRSILEQLGAGEGKAWDKKASAAIGKLSKKIVTEFPNLAGTLRNISSKFGLGSDYKLAADISKQERQTGLVEVESLLQRLYRNPGDAYKVLSFLNGDQKALSDEGRDKVLRDVASAIKEHFDTYIAALPVADRRLFEGLKFTDMLLKPEGLADLAKKSFGLHSAQAIFKPEERQEVSLDEFKQLLPFSKEDVVDSDKPLYQIFHTTADGKRGPYGFVSADKANDHPELDIDRSRVWYAAGMKNGQFNFRTRNISGKNLLDVAKRLSDTNLPTKERDDAIQQISSAMLTTMAALSHNSATKNLFAGLVPMGRVDGKASEGTIVFDSVDEINKVFKPAKKVTEGSLLEASDDESKIASIRKVAQRGDVWVKLPDNEAHYGPLAGKIIPGGVWSDMLDMHDRAPLFKAELLNDMITAFKKNKTVFSPATHVNNILTNYAMMLLHGIPHRALGDAAQLIVAYELRPGTLTQPQRDLMKAFYKSGAVLGQFTNAETKAYIADKLAKNITHANDKSVLDKLLAWGKVEKEFSDYAMKAQRGLRLTDNFLSEVYAAGDNVFRLAAFMNVAGTLQAKNNGKMTDGILQESGLAARKMFLDYDIDARWVRAARQSVLPFVSWSYAIAPVLGRLAITKPWAMVNMMAALYAMGAMGDDDDDEWRKKGPDAVRERSLWGMGPYNMIRLPFMGTDDKPVYYNIGKSIPMMSLFEPPQGKAKLFGFEWLPGVLQPSGPYVTLLANTFLNVDPFTGKQMYNPDVDTNFEKLASMGAAVWDTFAPPVASTRFFKQAQNVAQDKAGPTGEAPSALVLARTLGGLSLYQYDAGEAAFYKSKEIANLKREFHTVMAKARRDEYAKGYPDYEALDEKLNDLRARLQEKLAKARGEE